MIKKLLLLVVAVMSAMTLSAQSKPQRFKVKNADGVVLEYNAMSDSTCEVASYNRYNSSARIVIPSVIKYKKRDYAVVRIGDGAFGSCSRLTLVKIPNSVTEIGNYAFKGCSELASVEIPNSVTTIGESAFWLLLQPDICGNSKLCQRNR